MSRETAPPAIPKLESEQSTPYAPMLAFFMETRRNH
jgi:hypothetical protein